MKKLGIVFIALAIVMSFIVEASLANKNFEKNQLVPMIIIGLISLLIGVFLFLAEERK